MLNGKIQSALNKQINEEYYSSYLYLAMAAYMDDKNLDGCAHWMRMQAQEEYQHAMKIFDFVSDRGGRVELFAIAQPQKEWDSPVEAFKAALEHEIYMTKNINMLADLSLEVRDHATHHLMQWYIAEQVEEEASVDGIVKKLEMMGGDGPGLFMMDRELNGRAMPNITAGE